jgi:hypothetical protein
MTLIEQHGAFLESLARLCVEHSVSSFFAAIDSTQYEQPIHVAITVREHSADWWRCDIVLASPGCRVENINLEVLHESLGRTDLRADNRRTDVRS